jgi:hypothetical protein
VKVQFVVPERAIRSSWQPTEWISDGLYVVANVPIDKSGYWHTLVDIYDNDSQLTRAVFEWQISENASVIQSVPPSPLALISLLGIILSMAYVLYPAGRRLAQKMEWTAINVLVSGGVIFMTILSIALGIVAMQRQQVALELELHPPPELVNSVLPDASSLQQGAHLYNEYCHQWEGMDDFEALVNQLNVLRDDELYIATQKGWRDLPPCESDLTTTQRWHLVNYLRTRHKQD